MTISTVAVVGLGYVGLPTAVALARAGVKTIGIDVAPHVIQAIRTGPLHICEPGLTEHLEDLQASGALRVSETMEPAESFIIAVPTPVKRGHIPDLTHLEAASRSIAPVLLGGELIIVESTSPPGTTRRVAGWILDMRPDLSLDGSDGRPAIYLAHCPERVLPGNAMQEIASNDRVVGGLTPHAATRAKEIYATFCEGEIQLTDDVTAELVKLAENSFRDVNIAFANELSIVADTLGVNVWELISLANHHPRVNILQPGPGVGGHCIAVDPWFIAASAPEVTPLIRTARRVNDSKADWVVRRVLDIARTMDRPALAVLGLTFKPDSDDMRGSPAVPIVGRLAADLPDSTICVAEPYISALPRELQQPQIHLTDAPSALAAASIGIVLVDHTAFRDIPAPNPDRTTLIDTRGLWR